MDREAFLLEREDIQRRMEGRRQAANAAIDAKENSLMSRLLRTGAGMLLGFGARGGSVGMISTLLWSVLAPVAVGAAQRGGDALIQKLVNGIFPSKSFK